ncbi:putative ADP-ribosylation factor-like protein 5C isoform X3 [Elephas maximus indicus]|uniref:putative ADP-ribosylation factor-like protein 5C isoform X3 n=1 Tax=Elephas maximus indicus TaxID=99487 RepID=UPI002116606C|nr:putative ADP-ribosylation factor-like protein 5C isoform X3 [Elephas maximus indicus]
MGQLISKLMGIFGNQGLMEAHSPLVIGIDPDPALPPAAFRAQGYHRGAGQRRKNHHSLPIFIILVIDSTDRDRLLTTREELYKMLAHEALRDASVLIFANKQDVKDSMTTMEISRFLTLSAIKDHPWHIQGCCALTGEGLVAAPPGPPGPGPANG